MSNQDQPSETESYGLGLKSGAVVLLAHNPAWNAAYEIEAAAIRAALADRQLGVQHVGSTSIPNIRAKPILDIMVGIANFDQGPLLEPALASIGYDFARNVGIPDDHVFGKGIDRTHLVHVVEYKGAKWHRYLRFRDRLVADPALALEYDKLKGNLATQFNEDRASYTAAKQAFIDQVVATPDAP
jgi:GrpB-like predicted nucleotidyltransferase (UPF0157 family)